MGFLRALGRAMNLNGTKGEKKSGVPAAAGHFEQTIFGDSRRQISATVGVGLIRTTILENPN
jgi:hypothetical protein